MANNTKHYTLKVIIKRPSDLAGYSIKGKKEYKLDGVRCIEFTHEYIGYEKCIKKAIENLFSTECISFEILNERNRNATDFNIGQKGLMPPRKNKYSDDF